MRIFISLRILLSILIYTAANLLSCIVLPQDFSVLLCTGIGALSALPFLWFLYRQDARRRTQVSLAEQRGFVIPVILLALFSCLAFNGLLNLVPLSRFFPGYVNSVQPSLYSPGLAEQLLCTALLIPAAEELIFRGHTFFIIREQSRFWTAAVLSALFFALYHGNAVQGSYAFLMGLIAAWLAEQCKSLSFPYLFHSSANLFSILMTRFLPERWQSPGQTLLLAETLSATALTTVCICWIRWRFATVHR